jgi:ABC-type transport system involved in cytochrome bd biosynthesis fused ATPase/permease subunit
MKRRLGLAVILVKQPKIAILDEPTQGLDSSRAPPELSADDPHAEGNRRA